MLVLFETPAGLALFKVLKEKRVQKSDNVEELFGSADKAAEIVKLQAFRPFEDTTQALAAASAMVEGKMGDDMKKFLKKHIIKKELTDELAVMDNKLGGSIKEDLGIQCVSDSKVLQLFRGIRSQMTNLIDGLDDGQLRAMQLGLGHGLSRYKLKFSPDKVDTMIVQAINLLDELDKEINTYAMRVREWYGWHFPEMAKLVNDNEQYARVVLKMGLRSEARGMDFSSILPEDVEASMKEAAIVSMGTDISETDLLNICSLARQVIALMEYRTELFEYLKNRMMAIAPNLTMMVGELVGARLIAHAGSLLNLAKQPASTVQILGAEKALFRALKTKHDTPKYGLIYHASLIGQAQPKHKGKVSRVLAAKTALAIRVDALGDSSEATIALAARQAVENRMRQLDSSYRGTLVGTPAARSRTEGYSATTATDAAASGGATAGYQADGDAVKAAASSSEDEAPKSSKKSKKDKKEKKEKKEKSDKKEKKEKKSKKGSKRSRDSDDDASSSKKSRAD